MKHIDKNSSKHFGVCFIISLCCGLVGACIAMLVGILKEWYDKKSYGHWCWWDIFFDALGCGVGYLIHWLIL